MPNFRIYRFQTKIKNDTINDHLATFLKNKDGDLTEKERVWWSVSAFWLPLALQEAGGYSQEELTRYGLSAIARLQEQINYLTLILNLQSANGSAACVSAVANSCNGDIYSQEVENPIDTANTVNKADTSSDFDNMFG